MNKVLVAVVDSAKARFLALEQAEFPEERMGSRLIELDGLYNPLNEAQGQELWSSTKTGRNRGASGQAHSYDDHRDDHMAEFGRRFAQTIAGHITNLVQTEQIPQLILVAEPQITGFMREAIATAAPTNLHVSELTKNLSHLKPLELHKYLASQGLIPEPSRVRD